MLDSGRFSAHAYRLSICFDRFHVAKHFGDGVNRVRTQEATELRAVGDKTLVGTRYLWLQNPENTKADNKTRFETLRDTSLKVARAWAMKETARGLWDYSTRGWAQRAWNRLIDRMSRSRLDPMLRVAKMLREHLRGILNAIALNFRNHRSRRTRHSSLANRSSAYQPPATSSIARMSAFRALLTV